MRPLACLLCFPDCLAYSLVWRRWCERGREGCLSVPISLYLTPLSLPLANPPPSPTLSLALYLPLSTRLLFLALPPSLSLPTPLLSPCFTPLPTHPLSRYLPLLTPLLSQPPLTFPTHPPILSRRPSTPLSSFSLPGRVEAAGWLMIS